MQSTGARIGIVAALAALAVVLFIVLSGGDDDGGDRGTAVTATTATATVPQESPEHPVEVITMRDGAPVGGVKELEYEKGDRVRIRIVLDEPQEDIHIHGYEVEKLSPSGSASFDFPADLDGLFELEAHGPSGDVVLAEIRVSP